MFIGEQRIRSLTDHSIIRGGFGDPLLHSVVGHDAVVLPEFHLLHLAN